MSAEYQYGDGRCSECNSPLSVEECFCIGDDWGIRFWADGNPGDKVICLRCLTPVKVISCGNGMLAAFNGAGKQIAPLQGRFTECVSKLLRFANSETKFFGWPDIVEGGHLGEWRHR